MNKKVLFAIPIAVVIVALWFVLLWSPQSDDLDAAAERAEAAKAENDQLSIRLARLQELEERSPELVMDLAALRQAIPEEAELDQFIRDANEAAERSGVDFVSIAPTEPAASVNATLPSVVALVVNVEGGYFEVLDYLNRLDDLPRLVATDTLNLTASELEDTGAQQLTVAITARMFTAAPPVGSDAATAPAAPGDAGAGATTTTTPPSPDEATTTTEPST